MLRTHLALLTSAALVSSGLGLTLESANATEGTTEGTTGTATVTEHVANGTFQAGTTGWTSNQALRVVEATGRRGLVAVVTKETFARTTSQTVLADLPVTATSSPGRSYTARIDVKGNRDGITPRLVVRESNGQQQVEHARSIRLVDRGWQRLAFTLAPELTASELDVSVEVPLAGRQRLRIDNVSLKSRTRTTTPVDTRKSLSNGCKYSTRGVPECGVLVGAAYGGNTDPTAWEESMGQHLGVRRTYYNGTQVDSAVARSATDLAAGRIPWISFKLPYSWAEMAAGKGDAWTRDLATKLSRLDGPVWLAFHHEPEGDGNLAEWKAMQERLGPIVRSIAPNVAFTVILMGWHQLFGEEKYHLDNIWPNTKVDIAGFDLYDWYGTYKNGVMKTKHDDLPRDYFPRIAEWSREKGIPWGLAETGVSHPSALHDPEWMARTANSMEAFGGIAFTYFNTSLNNPEGTDWTLTLDVKRQVYTRLLKAAPHI